MKYMLMITGKQGDFEAYARWPKQELVANMAFTRTFSKELKDAGVYVSTEGLAFPNQGRLVRAGSNGEAVTDGVFPESKEFLAGYWVVEVESPEEAYRIAARLSDAPSPYGGAMPVEVRQVLDSAQELRR